MDYLQKLVNIANNGPDYVQNVLNLFQQPGLDQLLYVLPSSDDVLRFKLTNPQGRMSRNTSHYIQRQFNNQKWYGTFIFYRDEFNKRNSTLSRPCYMMVNSNARMDNKPVGSTFAWHEFVPCRSVDLPKIQPDLTVNFLPAGCSIY